MSVLGAYTETNKVGGAPGRVKQRLPPLALPYPVGGGGLRNGRAGGSKPKRTRPRLWSVCPG